ncbi:DUF58 domain-containing protein [Streptomyces calidiresistens]|uniref:DUF58 domain-containing protein n=1 Tax=Streptomyces calidiresistens TaxID=1485586 RepID=A0A7W3T371_9ACTN|nr:DUF58 domain-containing protein [Streptomyces calidiresistens]MBB0229963.1 DUF58 domain-containing protein [Streptomyces calidiresistens]
MRRAGGTGGRGSLRTAFSGLTTRGRSFLAAGLAATGCAYLLGQSELLRVGALLTVLPVLSVLVLHLGRSRVAASRRLTPERVVAGEESRVHLRVESTGRGARTGVLLLEDRVPYVLGPRPRFVLDRIEPGGHREVSYRVRSDLRGEYPLGPLQLRLTDPFGMVELNRSFSARNVMTVLPPTESLPDVLPGGEGGGVGTPVRSTVSFAGDDDVIPRGYRHGDDLRRVHWRATARHGTLMVRREEQPHRERCTVLLDTRGSAWKGSGPGSPFETAVGDAASVVAHLLERGWAVRLITDTGLELPGSGTRPAEGTAETGTAIMEALARIDHSEHTDFAELAAVPTPPGDGLLIAFLGAVRVGRHHDLERLRSRHTSSVAFVAAGGQEEIVERRQHRELHEAGWTVVPREAGTPLADDWLRAAAPPAAAAG